MMKLCKTQRQIRKALLVLLSSKRFDEITAKDITAQAEISRSTFYSYYDSKYDLLEELEEELTEGFLDIMLDLRATGKDVYYKSIRLRHNDHFIAYFQYIKAHFFEFKVLLSPNCTTGFMTRFSRAITRTRLETIRIWYGYASLDDITRDSVRVYREEILSALYVSFFVTWVNRDMDLPVEKMADMLIELWGPLASFGRGAPS